MNFCWEIDVLRRNKIEILEANNSICQIENTVESINNSLCEAEERTAKLVGNSLEKPKNKQTKK